MNQYAGQNGSSTIDAVLLNPSDNVAVAARDLSAGSEIRAGEHRFELVESIGLGHKIAVRDVAKGERIYKYGQTIGFATQDIKLGTRVHTHNLTAGEFTREYAPATEIPPDPQPLEGYTFEGYRRPNGRVGTRNYIAVISTVNCSASVSKYIARRFDHSILDRYPQVDGILPLVHKSGCGIQYDGEDHHQLNRVLAGFARHPNVA
ncbi:MAG: UxaA family hydrolase, partial [Planctomycetales bacterium]|nr:UxaA family hydrolase [Planctomycetales bacterium]